MIRADKRKRQEKEIVQAALDFAACEQSQTDLKILRESDSNSVPAEYLLLLERCERFKKFMNRTHDFGKYVIR